MADANIWLHQRYCETIWDSWLWCVGISGAAAHSIRNGVSNSLYRMRFQKVLDHCLTIFSSGKESKTCWLHWILFPVKPVLFLLSKYSQGHLAACVCAFKRHCKREQTTSFTLCILKILEWPMYINNIFYLSTVSTGALQRRSFFFLRDGGPRLGIDIKCSNASHLLSVRVPTLIYISNYEKIMHIAGPGINTHDNLTLFPWFTWYD